VSPPEKISLETVFLQQSVSWGANKQKWAGGTHQYLPLLLYITAKPTLH